MQLNRCQSCPSNEQPLPDTLVPGTWMRLSLAADRVADYVERAEPATDLQRAGLALAQCFMRHQSGECPLAGQQTLQDYDIDALDPWLFNVALQESRASAE